MSPEGIILIIILVLFLICSPMGWLARSEADKQGRSTTGWFWLGFFFGFNAFLALKLSKNAGSNGHDMGLWSFFGLFFFLPALIAFETGLNAENKHHDFDCWVMLGFLAGVPALLISCFLQAYAKNERTGAVQKTAKEISRTPTTTYLYKQEPSVPKIVNTWDCPKCGETNRYDALKCINCYTDKPKG